MSTDASNAKAKLDALNGSLDQLEDHLEPLLSQPLSDTLSSLSIVQQAKLQTVIPYVLYDLVFMYLKCQGVDPKSHPVFSELDRIRQYFTKISDAEKSLTVSETPKTTIDKPAADRFIRHAIAQAQNAQSSSSKPSPPVASTSSSQHVPVKVTSKMAERAAYEKTLREMDENDGDESDVLDVVDEDEDMDVDSAPPKSRKGKGKEKGKTGSKRQRDPERKASKSKKAKLSSDSNTQDEQAPTNPKRRSNAPSPSSTSSSSKAAKKAEKKAAKRAAKNGSSET